MHGGGGAAACETEKVWPAIVSVPVRAAPLFAAAVNDTVPLPLPDPPLEIAIHDAFDVAVQAQPLFAVTPTVPLAPFASADWLVGEMVYAHGGGAGTAACVTVSVSPAIVSVPVRAAAVFAATV